MKLALTVLHGNITDSNSKFVGNNEAISIAKVLAKNFDVDILTCNNALNCIHVTEEYDINKYDAFIVVNGSLNMFGGLEIDTATTIYKLMHKFDKQIYYALTDLSMPFVDYYSHISSKSWSYKYSKNDFSLKNDIIILSQFSNFGVVRNLHKNCNIKDIIYVPFAKWKVELLDPNCNLPIKENGISLFFDPGIIKSCDLIYGGSFRSGKRVHKMLEYFFNRDISVNLYGNIKLDQFSNYFYDKAPNFLGKVPLDQVVYSNNSGLATIIIGDNNYNNSTVTLRVYESLLSDAIVFIDNDFDTAHQILNNDWLYVKSGEELEQKINYLKSNKDFYEACKINQHNLVRSLIANKELTKILYNIFNGGKCEN